MYYTHKSENTCRQYRGTDYDDNFTEIFPNFNSGTYDSSFQSGIIPKLNY